MLMILPMRQHEGRRGIMPVARELESLILVGQTIVEPFTRSVLLAVGILVVFEHLYQLFVVHGSRVLDDDAYVLMIKGACKLGHELLVLEDDGFAEVVDRMRLEEGPTAFWLTYPDRGCSTGYQPF